MIRDLIVRRWFRGWVAGVSLGAAIAASTGCAAPAERTPCFARAMALATARNRLECRGQEYDACPATADIERELVERMRQCP